MWLLGEEIIRTWGLAFRQNAELDLDVLPVTAEADVDVVSHERALDQRDYRLRRLKLDESADEEGVE